MDPFSSASGEGAGYGITLHTIHTHTHDTRTLHTIHTHTQHAHTVHTVLPGPVDPFSSIGGFSDDPFKTPTATTFGGSGGFSDPFAVS